MEGSRIRRARRSSISARSRQPRRRARRSRCRRYSASSRSSAASRCGSPRRGVEGVRPAQAAVKPGSSRRQTTAGDPQPGRTLSPSACIRLYNPRMIPRAAALFLAATLRWGPAGQQQAADPVAHAQAVLASIAGGEFSRVEEQFTDEMKAALPPGRLAAMWKTLATQAGPYKSCGKDARLRTIGDKQMVITPCQFARAAVDVQFA